MMDFLAATWKFCVDLFRGVMFASVIHILLICTTVAAFGQDTFTIGEGEYAMQLWLLYAGLALWVGMDISYGMRKINDGL